MRPLFHNLKQVNYLFYFLFTFSNVYQVQVAKVIFLRVLKICISDISCKTTLNRYYDLIKIISRKTIYIDNSWHNSVVVMAKLSNYGCITLPQRPELFTSFIEKQSNYTNICIVLLRFVNILKIWFQYKLCYCLIILVLHWKILISDFWQRLVLSKKAMSSSSSN